MRKHSHRYLTIFSLSAALLLAALWFLTHSDATALGNPLPDAELARHHLGTPSQTDDWVNRLHQEVTTTIAPSDDTYVWHYQPNTAFGNETTFWAYPNDGIPLLKFPLQSIPAGAEIVHAAITMTMNPYAYPWGSGDTAAVRLLNRGDWDENSVTWNTMPDVDSNAPEAVTTLNPHSPMGTDMWDVTELVRYARSSAFTDTLPIGIFPQGGNWNDSHEWLSKENPYSPSAAPQLQVVYRAAAATPTPTPTPSPTPAPTYRFGGQILGPGGAPMQGVTVTLTARQEEDTSWTQLQQTTTDSNGRFSFSVWDRAYDYYRIVMDPPPGWTCSDAVADHGTVIDCNTIEYHHPEPGSYTGSTFHLVDATQTHHAWFPVILKKR